MSDKPTDLRELLREWIDCPCVDDECDLVKRTKNALAQPPDAEPEPVGWMWLEDGIEEYGAPYELRPGSAVPLYAAPQPAAGKGEKRAPVQGYVQGIPWEMHLRAYDVYCKKHGPQPAMIDLEGRGCRGGFHTEELDEFIPGWRDELEELPRLRKQLADAIPREIHERLIAEAKEHVQAVDEENFHLKRRAETAERLLRERGGQ